ncbi:MAG: LCP family protein [Bacilli bacterium]|nr:LCP family protein [Bacilli bacterium]MBO5414425.1 LCP family protein [Bacilli bacterium]
MKVLFNKIKKSNKILLTIYLLSFIAYLVTFVFFTGSLLSLKGIETFLRIGFIALFALWIIIYFIWNLVNLILKRNKTLIITTIITILLSVVFGFGSYFINKVYNKLEKLTSSNTTVYTTYLISMKDTKIDKDSKLGMIKNKKDVEGHILAKELIKKENLDNKIEYYDDYYELLSDLYNNEIDGIFVSSNYVILFASEDAYKNIDTDTKIVYEHSKKMKNQDNIGTTNKKLTEPFSVLVMGVDSQKDGLNANAAFNGDTLMIITFNPKTLTATMFSIPRDTYVPIACNHNAYNKINSSAAYGTNCVIDTVENLIDIDIDYYAKINFRGFIDLVDAIGGVDVEVEQPDYSFYVKQHGKGRLCESNSLRDTTNLVCMDTGWQHLNGEQALAYARNRHGFIESDIARNRHQQQIVEAVAKKAAKLKSFESFESLLDAISENIATNMTTNQILSFYDVLKDMLANSLNGDEFITIKKTYLELYSLPVYLQYAYMYSSALGYYPDSLEAIKKLMKVNLELEEKETIKTFEYTYGENYEAGITGKNITTGAKLQLVPDFTGSSESYVRDWASKNNISVEVIGGGATVIEQSIHPGVLAKSISRITINLG